VRTIAELLTDAEEDPYLAHLLRYVRVGT